MTTKMAAQLEQAELNGTEVASAQAPVLSRDQLAQLVEATHRARQSSGVDDATDATVPSGPAGRDDSGSTLYGSVMTKSTSVDCVPVFSTSSENATAGVPDLSMSSTMYDE